ncbi:MAG: hypothetical protein LBQ73_10190 [Tannerellaceae bacterium]|nr:hypothetical protein [Tannerellaceae bacterium]
MKAVIEKKEKEKEFDTVAFFRDVKEKMAKATEGMTLQEERHYWQLMREGKVKLS